jgi:hypothetical protein
MINHRRLLELMSWVMQKLFTVRVNDQEQKTPSCSKSHGVKVQLKKMIGRESSVYRNYPLGWA